MKSIRLEMIAGLVGVSTAMLIAALPAWAAGPEGFVVVPEKAPRFAGPAGMESFMTEVLATAEQTRGAFGIWRYEIPPGGGPGSHIHRGEDEFFLVLSGTFDFQVGDGVERAPAGSFVFIPRLAVHTFKNVGLEPEVLVGGVTPAGFEGYFMRWKDADENTLRALETENNMEIVGPPLQ